MEALRSFGASPSFRELVRKLDKKTYVTTSVFTGVPFDETELNRPGFAGGSNP